MDQGAVEITGYKLKRMRGLAVHIENRSSNSRVEAARAGPARRGALRFVFRPLFILVDSTFQRYLSTAIIINATIICNSWKAVVLVDLLNGSAHDNTFVEKSECTILSFPPKGEIVWFQVTKSQDFLRNRQCWTAMYLDPPGRRNPLRCRLLLAQVEKGLCGGQFGFLPIFSLLNMFSRYRINFPFMLNFYFRKTEVAYSVHPT